MSRTRRSQADEKITPSASRSLKSLDEVNAPRLGLISVQERIPNDFTSWEVRYHVEGRPAYTRCVAPSEYGGVPHGLDGDISLALNRLFLEQGTPVSGEVNATAYQILQTAGFPDAGHYYRALTESLQRLSAATYSIGELWRDHRNSRWASVTFSFIERLDVNSSNADLYSSGTILRIRLAEPLVASMRAAYLKPLDVVFLASLSRPITRSLYRLLDARRYNIDRPTSPISTLEMNLVDWALDCKLRETQPAKIRRNLTPAHEELIMREYLESVTYEGERGATTICYKFATEQVGSDKQDVTYEPVVKALRQQGVSLPVTRDLISTFGEVHVTARLEKFQALIASGYKARKPSALLVDVIRDQVGKYPDIEPAVPGQTVAAQRLKLARQAEREAAQIDQKAKDDFDQLPLDEQAARAVTTVRMLMGSELRDGHLRGLLSAMLGEKVKPADVYRGALRAAAELRLPELAEQIRQTYNA